MDYTRTSDRIADIYQSAPNSAYIHNFYELH